MDCLEPKKMALIRILQILQTHSDCDHPLRQEDIACYLEKDYGITIDRKDMHILLHRRYVPLDMRRMFQ